MKRKALFIVLSLIVIFSITLIGCGTAQEGQEEEVNDNHENQENQQTADNSEQILIYTSIYPLYDFAKKIAGDKAKVVNLVPTGAETHDFEPTPKDIIELSKANLFVYNGGGFETWIEKIIDSVNTNNEMTILDTSSYVELLPNEESGEHHDEQADEQHDDHGHDDHSKDEDTHGHDEEHAHEQGDLDPHVWLDPILAKLQAEAIKDALIEIDQKNAEYYEGNYTQLVNQFDELHVKYHELSENIERRDFVVSHAAFGYIASRYDLNQIAISGLSPSNEPSARQLQKIIEFVKENQIQYIMFENLVVPKVAEVVRQEVGADVLVLHNLEALTKEEISQGKDYFSIMEDNLEALKKALGYK
jgi:zinc transport system substrate-binding protein